MEPFTMMIGYGLVNSLSQLVVRPIADKMSQGGRRDDMLFQMEEKHKLDLEMLRLNKEIEIDNNFNIQQYSHQLRMEEARGQFMKQLEMWQLGQFNQTMWPLLTPFDHPSLSPQNTKQGQTPINVFMAKTDPKSPFSALMQSDVKNRLSNFLQTTYSNDSEHPCICRIGDWKDGFQDAAFINALWYGLQGQPCIVINPIQSEFGELLDLNVSLWGLASSGYAPITQTVISGPFASAIGRLKRAETQQWIEAGLPCDSSDLQHNANLLEIEKKLKNNGRPDSVIEQLLIQYRLPREIQNNVINAFSREYSHMMACVTGMFTDIYHLVEYGATPYMPTAINEYNRNNNQHYQIPDITINHYRKALADLTCTNYLQDRLPFAYLNVAKAIKYNSRMAHEVFQDSIGVWANRKETLTKEIAIPESIEGCVKLLKDNADITDDRYLSDAKRVLIDINEPDAARELDVKIYTLSLESNDDSSNGKINMYYEVSEWSTYSIDAFLEYTESSLPEKTRIVACIIYSGNGIIVVCVDEQGKLTSSKRSPVQFIITDSFIVDQEQSCFFYDNQLTYDIITKKFISKKIKLMDNKGNGTFEELGRRFDEILRTYVPKKRPPISGGTPTFEDELERVFSNGTNMKIERENVDRCIFDAILTWVKSKLPLYGVAKAHVFKTVREGKINLYLVFADSVNHAFLDGSLPMKHIICNSIDEGLIKFFNGLSVATIDINQ